MAKSKNVSVDINAEKKNITCNVCGSKFEPIISKHYVSRDTEYTGAITALTKQLEPSIYDTFDCPVCGCQNAMQKRKRVYDNEVDIQPHIFEEIALAGEQQEGDK